MEEEEVGKRRGRGEEVGRKSGGEEGRKGRGGEEEEGRMGRRSREEKWGDKGEDGKIIGGEEEG